MHVGRTVQADSERNGVAAAQIDELLVDQLTVGLDGNGCGKAVLPYYFADGFHELRLQRRFAARRLHLKGKSRCGGKIEGSPGYIQGHGPHRLVAPIAVGALQIAGRGKPQDQIAQGRGGV